MDPHRNIFYFYHRQVKETDGINLDTQLKNNTPKALYNVLEHSDKEQVLRPFIKGFLKLTPPKKIDSVQFALQKRDIYRHNIRKRVLLTIDGGRNAEDQKLSIDTKRTGLPDGWIWCRDWAILNENKLSQKPSEAQLLRHMKGAEGWWAKTKPRYDRRTRKTWNNVHEFFKGLKVEGQSRFLVDQFTNYLEWIGMAKTWKLGEEDFAFFTVPAKERDPAHRERVSSKMETLMEKLKEKPIIKKLEERYAVPKKDRPRPFSYFGKAKTQGEGFWFAFLPEYSWERAHFGFLLTESWLRIQLFAPHLSFSRSTLRKIRDNKVGFLRMMKTLGRTRRGKNDAWFVQETPYKNPASPYKGRDIDMKSLREIFSVSPNLVNETIVDQALTLIERLLKRRNVRPEIKLARRFDRGYILSSKDFLGELEKTVADFLPYLDFFAKHPRRRS